MPRVIAHGGHGARPRREVHARARCRAEVDLRRARPRPITDPPVGPAATLSISAAHGASASGREPAPTATSLVALARARPHQRDASATSTAPAGSGWPAVSRTRWLSATVACARRASLFMTIRRRRAAGRGVTRSVATGAGVSAGCRCNRRCRHFALPLAAAITRGVNAVRPRTVIHRDRDQLGRSLATPRIGRSRSTGCIVFPGPI